MILSLLLLAQTVAPPAATWPNLPPFPLPRGANLTDATDFVRMEVAAGRCKAAIPSAQGSSVTAPMAILVGSSGTVRQIVPQAIGCPTVEQYTVGYLLSLTRTQASELTGLAEGWYGLTITYRW